MELETINKLYLELSQVATAETSNEIILRGALSEERARHTDTIQQLYAVADLIKAGQIDDALSIISTLTIPF